MIKLKELFNKVLRHFKIKSKTNNTTADINTVCVDLGASSIKMYYNGEYIKFRSSVREIEDTNEITTQKNVIRVNNKWYAVGESIVPTGNYFYKYEKPHLEVLILFGLNMLGLKESNTLKVNLVLPYNQLSTFKKLQDRLNGVYKVTTLATDEVEVVLDLNRAYVEGETSKVYFEDKYNIKSNICTVNIGYSTVDSTLYNTLGHRESMSSINIGTNTLLSNYLRHTKAPTSSILGSWLSDGYRFNNTEKRAIITENERYIDTVWNDVYNSVLRLANPQNTTVILSGGGSILLKNEIRQVLGNTDFRIVVPDEEECVYSDLKGMVLLSNVDIVEDKIEVVPEDVVEEVQVVFNEVVETVETVPHKVPTPPSNYERYVKLKEQDYSNKDIAVILGLSINTIVNYGTKYNKSKTV